MLLFNAHFRGCIKRVVQFNDVRNVYVEFLQTFLLELFLLYLYCTDDCFGRNKNTGIEIDKVLDIEKVAVRFLFAPPDKGYINKICRGSLRLRRQTKPQ